MTHSHSLVCWRPARLVIRNVKELRILTKILIEGQVIPMPFKLAEFKWPNQIECLVDCRLPVFMFVNLRFSPGCIHSHQHYMFSPCILSEEYALKLYTLRTIPLLHLSCAMFLFTPVGFLFNLFALLFLTADVRIDIAIIPMGQQGVQNSSITATWHKRKNGLVVTRTPLLSSYSKWSRK